MVSGSIPAISGTSLKKIMKGPDLNFWHHAGMRVDYEPVSGEVSRKSRINPRRISGTAARWRGRIARGDAGLAITLKRVCKYLNINVIQVNPTKSDQHYCSAKFTILFFEVLIND